jgi:hypothetical protein
MILLFEEAQIQANYKIIQVYGFISFATHFHFLIFISISSREVLLNL